ncbi:MAG: hypothetical protein Q9P44_15195 [Anaerolineae bacterium]|nr:hypothetical protein [Anaerolineae bacterium]
MRLIVLTGLATIEKGALASDLADYFLQHGETVMVVDNITRQPIKNLSVPPYRITGDIVTQLTDVLSTIASDIVLLAISEQVHPDKLWIALDNLTTQFDTIEIQTLALIDTRTCDCFPNVRESLESYADTVVMLPYNLDEVLNHVNP